MHIAKPLVVVAHDGYFAGTLDGIVKVEGEASARRIDVLDARNLQCIASTTSLDTGRYLIMNVDPEKEYLLICRDYERNFEPWAWDFVKPENNLSITEQLALWRSWQQ